MKIEGVEIFSVGTWNEDAFSISDLEEMVRAFNENAVGARPHLKLGHDPKQVVGKALMKTEGLPALGWVEKLYVRGEKLVADFADIPEKLFALIQKRGYRKVSSEIFFNITIGDEKYKRMLGAVALLGAETPGVMNLADILASYKSTFKKYDKMQVYETELKTSSTKGKRMEKTEAEIRLELDNEKLSKETAELKEFKAKAEKEKADADKELADLKTFKAQAEKEKIELEAQAEVARVESFTTTLVADKLCTPAMKPLIAALLGETKKSYSVKIKNEEKSVSKEELLKETLKLFKAASEVNFEESSSAGKKDGEKKEDEIDAKAKEYAKKHSVTYGQAVKAVLSEQA